MFGHADLTDGCHLCTLYRTREDYRRLWDGDSRPAADPTACRFRGADIPGPARAVLGLPHAGTWARCGHPDRPLGEHVCPCRGCGPTCRGYAEPVEFDRVVLINLKRRPDRLTEFRRLQTTHGWRLPEPVVVPAVDGNAVGVPPGYTAGGGAFGCRQSHVGVLEQALTDGVRQLLVLEDDVVWEAGVWAALEAFLAAVPGDWEQLMLGGQHVRQPEPVSPGVVRCTNCQRTHAYAVRGEALRDLLHLWYGCDTHIDHRMGPWQRTRRVYAPDPFVFGQGGGRSDINGAEQPPRFWCKLGDADDRAGVVVVLRADRATVDALRRRGWHTGHWRDGEGRDRGLVDIASVNGESKRANLQSWLELVGREAEGILGGVVTVWHEGITAGDLRGAGARRVVEVTAASADDAVRQLEMACAD